MQRKMHLHQKNLQLKKNNFKIVRFQLLRQQNPSQTSLLQHRSR
jgi:hypothetical protein